MTWIIAFALQYLCPLMHRVMHHGIATWWYLHVCNRYAEDKFDVYFPYMVRNTVKAHITSFRNMLAGHLHDLAYTISVIPDDNDPDWIPWDMSLDQPLGLSIDDIPDDDAGKTILIHNYFVDQGVPVVHMDLSEQ